MNVNGSISIFIKVYEAIGWFINVYEGVWVYMS